MNRKDDHVKYALMQEYKKNDFDKLRFIHSSLLSISYNEVNLKTTFCGHDIDYPIYINAMTGGSDKAYEINDKLSRLANHFKFPIASGSLSAAIKDPKTTSSFKIIKDNIQNGIVMANIGADKCCKDVKVAVSLLNADILQVHLNTTQELIMPEGERDFRNWENNIKEIIASVNIPVILKEVGFGMSKFTIEKLKSLGVKTIDVSGTGGTNFAEIENNRRDIPLGYLNSWGLSTVESLFEANTVDAIEILASGGIRYPLDVVKALALGAKAVGLSSFFLKLVTNNTFEESINIIEQFLSDVKTIMTLLGAKEISDLKNTELTVNLDLSNYLSQRNINKEILIKRK
jgi:isopentenyl-diphosphate delta-isomerase